MYFNTFKNKQLASFHAAVKYILWKSKQTAIKYISVWSKKYKQGKLAYLHLEWGCAGDSLRSSLQELDVLSTWLVRLSMICWM